MFDKKEESILNELFSSREEFICVITDYDKEKIKELVKDNYSFRELLSRIEELSNNKKTENEIKDNLESYIDGIHAVSSYENEKFYKIGFADAINLMIECLKVNK
ncbi:MAG: hypothetical protein IKD77_00485 [Bacilli bacterium]|nr:hypothetical protein [Bacilli bacterium]